MSMEHISARGLDAQWNAALGQVIGGLSPRDHCDGLSRLGAGRDRIAGETGGTDGTVFECASAVGSKMILGLHIQLGRLADKASFRRAF